MRRGLTDFHFFFSFLSGSEMLTRPSGEDSSTGASASVVTKRLKGFEINKWNAVAFLAWVSP